jgi:uncharacterized sulfatase
MHRTKSLSTLLLQIEAFVGLSMVVFSSPSFAGEHPNILWLTSEDHGPHMGCYGDRLAVTPNVDALAQKGMRFRFAWSNVPVCAPARTAIITGLYPSSSGGLHMRSMVSLPDNIRMFPNYLREAGYYCTNNSKTDYNVREASPIWDESSSTATWKNRPGGKPFFAVFNSTKSHESQIRKRPHRSVTSPSDVRVPSYHPDTPEVRQDWAQYYDKVSEADADAGNRLAELEREGLADDTIVFYFSDHGSGMPRSKRWPCNSGLQVPFIVFFPPKWQHLAPKDYQPSGQSERLISFVDLAPTMLSLAGLQPPEWMQGHAFAGPYQQQGPEFIFGERGRMDERMDCVRSVSDGRYVYIRNYFPHVSQAQKVAYQFETPTTAVWYQWFIEGKTDRSQSIFWQVPKDVEELYDLESDPDEVLNLAQSPEHTRILQTFRRALEDHLIEVRDICFLPEPELHVRSNETTPYQLARDMSSEQLARIYTAAETASSFDPGKVPELIEGLHHEGSAIRYWSVLGLRIRGRDTVVAHADALVRALHDDSPSVRIAAAESLAMHGSEQQVSQAIEELSHWIEPQANGVLVAMSALAAVESLEGRASQLHEGIRSMNPVGPMSDPRYDSYVPRLIQNIGAMSGSPKP